MNTYFDRLKNAWGLTPWYFKIKVRLLCEFYYWRYHALALVTRGYAQ